MKEHISSEDKALPGIGGAGPRSPQLWQPHKGWSGRCLEFVLRVFCFFFPCTNSYPLGMTADRLSELEWNKRERSLP